MTMCQLISKNNQNAMEKHPELPPINPKLLHVSSTTSDLDLGTASNFYKLGHQKVPIHPIGMTQLQKSQSGLSSQSSSPPEIPQPVSWNKREFPMICTQKKAGALMSDEITLVCTAPKAEITTPNKV